MNLNLLRPGHRVRTQEGREAEVLGESPEGSAVRVAYLGAEGPYGIRERTGAEDSLGGGEIEALLGAEPPRAWRERLAVVLHYIPESNEGTAEYRAETLSGAPGGVTVSGGGASGKAALDHLLGGLWLMGFRGTAEVSDGSGEEFRRYEVEVPAEGRGRDG